MLIVFIIDSKQKKQILVLSRNLCLKIKTFSISNYQKWQTSLGSFRSNNKTMLRIQFPNKNRKVSKYKMIIKRY